MKKIHILLVASVICSASIGHCQVDQRDQWMNKYWFYRYRLINNYMIVGEGSGKSIPANSRESVSPENIYDGFGNWGEKLNDPNNPGVYPNRNSTIAFGDGTTYLGWYIAVLASEYGCLKAFTLPTDPTGGCMNQTGMELKYAMEALERLDAKGENDQNFIYYKDHSHDISDQPNGFIIRDDVHLEDGPTSSPYQDFIFNPYSADNGTTLKNATTLEDNADGVANWYKLNSTKILSHSDPQKYTYVSKISSDFTGAYSASDPKKIDPSKDQYAHLFMGLAMVIKFCTDADNYQGYYFKAHAQTEMGLMMHYFTNLGTNYFMLKHPLDCPDGYVYSNGSPTEGMKDHSGQNNDLGPGFYTINKKYNGSNYYPAPAGCSVSQWYWMDEAAIYTGMGGNFFNGINLMDKNDPWVFEAYMPGLLASCGNAFIDEAFPNYFHYKPDNGSFFNTKILRRMGAYWDYQIYPLMHDVLFGISDSKYGQSNYTGLLDAPCYGPRNFGPQHLRNDNNGPLTYTLSVKNKTGGTWTGNWSYDYNGYDSYEWSTGNRWLYHAKRGLGDMGGYFDPNAMVYMPDINEKGEWNGLDYMLFYNLYMYKYGNANGGSEIPQTGFKNELTNYLNDIYPKTLGGLTVGNNSSPKKNIGFKSITSTEHIQNGGNVVEQAGEEIDLEPGFEADNGSYYSAEAENLTDCIDNGNTYESPWVNKIPDYQYGGQYAPPQSQMIYQDLNVLKPANQGKSNNSSQSKFELVNVYPNPFHTEINIDFTAIEGASYQLSIINSLGVVVKCARINNDTVDGLFTYKMNASELSPGAYTIVVNDGKNISQKRIINY